MEGEVWGMCTADDVTGTMVPESYAALETAGQSGELLYEARRSAGRGPSELLA
jgi:hypothetical protein